MGSERSGMCVIQKESLRALLFAAYGLSQPIHSASEDRSAIARPGIAEQGIGAFVATAPERRVGRAMAATCDERAGTAYGRLADALLWSALELAVLSRLRPDFTFLNIGGGDGRWTHSIATRWPDSTGVRYGVSGAGSGPVEARATEHGYAGRIEQLRGDVADVADRLAGRTFDLVFTTHHLLGFVADPEQVIGALARLLAADGLMASFLPSRWHAAFGDLCRGDVEGAERSLTGREWAASEAPYTHLFTPGEIRAMHTSAGMNVEVLTGFPSLVHPHGAGGDASVVSVEELLSDEAVFRRVLSMESELLVDPDAGARGANFLVAASHADARSR